MIGIFTSESVGKGHPDKICDQISDAILDEVLKKDINAKIAIEVMASNRLIIIGGELTTTTYVDFVKIAWEILMQLGYTENDFSILSNVNKQSEEIKNSVDLGDDIGSGDQGIIFGYATNETKNYMPIAITVAHELVKKAEELRITKKIPWIMSDMKSQVTVNYKKDNVIEISDVLMSIQHTSDYNINEFKKNVITHIIKPIISLFFKNTNYKILINPSGSFVVGGPIGDTGLTGRKIIVDTYGGSARHGGGAFSGKDCTKVDRSAAYAARWVAKNLVAAGVASRLEIQLSYAIGIAKPISVSIESFGTETIAKEKIAKIVESVFDLSPKGIITALNLRAPIYLQTATYGHFGREDLSLPWENLDKVNEIKKWLDN
ncbi:MAG: methionine adenosyltransferase [Mycoplasmataceae bacterium]|nr:methionine adenosyltransferase [Mycoplasmataceae bacterium]